MTNKKNSKKKIKAKSKFEDLQKELIIKTKSDWIKKALVK